MTTHFGPQLECVWLYPRGTPFGPFSQPMKGRLMKDSSLGIMFRPEASDVDIEARASQKYEDLSSSSLKRLVFRPKFLTHK